MHNQHGFSLESLLGELQSVHKHVSSMAQSQIDAIYNRLGRITEPEQQHLDMNLRPLSLS